MASLIDSYLLTAPAKSHQVIETSDDEDDGVDNEDSYPGRLAGSSNTPSVRLNTLDQLGKCSVYSFFTMKCTKMSPTTQKYLATIPEYEYLPSSPPSSITELDWSGRVRTSTSSELRMEWTCLDNPHCWDKTGE